MRISDWSSDVCSSDLQLRLIVLQHASDRLIPALPYNASLCFFRSLHIIRQVSGRYLRRFDFAVSLLLKHSHRSGRVIMEEYYFSLDLGDNRTLYLSPMTDRWIAMSGEEVPDPSGYFLFEKHGRSEERSVGKEGVGKVR